MLDYTLVSTKATYRLLTPTDVPAYVALVQARYREERPGVYLTPAAILATVRELEHDRLKGTVFVFEADQALTGYSILINRWSNERGGTVIEVDELYVVPARRADGIAEDFLTLLSRVVPAGTVAIDRAIDRRSKRERAVCRQLGFEETGRVLFSLRVPPEPR
jgi:GNAT superfamily N-acetyltransferase